MAGIPKSIQASLYIDGKPAEGTIRNVQQAARALRGDIDRLVIGSEEYNRSVGRLASYNQILQNHRDQIRGIGSEFQSIHSEIKKFGSLALGYLGFDFITDQYQDIIINNAKLSDSLADVRKTTGLSEEAVRRLNTELGKIKTRTSREELIGLAEVAGKLGVAGERDVLGFVRAADKIKVALGGDLGDAETAINSLGKLTELFKIKDQFGLEQSLIKTGSAINSLGAAGTAGEAYLVEFTKRMGGIAPQANFSIQSILGLAATMDELGQPVEASSTAIGQFIVGLGKDIPGFARIAGMSVKEFSAVLKRDGNQALLEVLKNLQTTGTGVAGLAEKMGLVGEDGARAVTALGALSNNLDLLVTRQKLANDEFDKGTSLQQEFDVKMASLGATVDLLKKKFTDLGTNTVLMDFLKRVLFGFSQFLDWGQRNAAMIVTVTKLLIIGAVAWGSYRAAVLLSNATMQASAALTALNRTAMLSFAAAQAIVTGNTARATAAMRLLNVTASANPFGALIAVVTTLAAAFLLFRNSAAAAQKTQETFNDIDAQAKKNLIDQTERINALRKIIDDETIARDKRLEAVKKLKEVMPDALKHLSDEAVLTDKGRTAINKYIQALERRSTAEAAYEKIKELKKQNIDLRNNPNAEVSTLDEIQAAALTMWTGDRSRGAALLAGKMTEKNQTQIKDNLTLIKQIQDRYKTDLADMTGGVVVSDVTTGGASTGGLTDKKGENKAEQEKRKALAEFEKLDDQYKKLQAQRLDDQLSAYEREVAQEARKYEALINEEKEFLKFKGISAEQRKATEERIKTLGSDKETAVNSLRLRQETEMLQKIAELRTRLADVHESELVKQQNDINKFYDNLERENNGNEKVLARLRQERTRELADAEIREKERLEKEKSDIESKYNTLSGTERDNKLAAINKKYDDEIEALKLKFSKELQATQKFQDAVDAINKNRNAEIYTEITQKKLLEKRDFEIQMAQQVADATFSIISNNQRAQLDRKLNSIEKERQSELSAKNITETQKDAINEKYNKKVKAEKEKAWKAEQAAAVAQALINGAIAVTKVLSQTGVLAPFAIPAIAAGTALQIATIIAQPMPQFAQGGFSDQEPAGFVSKSTIFSKSASGRPFEAGERGREWIAPNWMVQSPRFANIISTLEMARKEKRSFATGGFTDFPAPGGSAPSTSGQGYDMALFTAALDRMAAAQEDANRRPINFVYSKFEEFTREIELVRDSQRSKRS